MISEILVVTIGPFVVHQVKEGTVTGGKLEKGSHTSLPGLGPVEMPSPPTTGDSSAPIHGILATARQPCWQFAHLNIHDRGVLYKNR